VRDFVTLIDELADALGRLGLRYALGGALATSYWGVPRTTQDIDLLVALPALKYQELADALDALGCKQRDERGQWVTPSVACMRRQVAERNLIECRCDSTLIELFVPVVPLQDEILRRAVPKMLGARQMPITSAEDMILLKLAFHRIKDLQDVRGILRVQQGSLDLDYLRRWSARSHSQAVQQELDELIALSAMPGPP
jgi:hypothetical protein